MKVISPSSLFHVECSEDDICCTDRHDDCTPTTNIRLHPGGPEIPISCELVATDISQLFISSYPPKSPVQGGMLASTSPVAHQLSSLARETTPASVAPPTLHRLGGDDLTTFEGGKKKRWHLGLRSNSSPGHIMNAVFKAMKRCKFEWKVINPYLVIARQPEQIGHTTRQIKLCLRLYEMDKRQCLLDFQNVSSFKDSDLNNKIELESPKVHRHRYPSASSEDSASEKENHEILEFFEMCGRLISELS